MADGGLEKIADAAFTSDRGWPPPGGHLRTFLLGSHADLGNDEFYQFRARRIRDARHVCEPARRRVAWRRPGGVWICSCVRTVLSWGRDLFVADSLCAAWADAGANTLDLRSRTAATVYGVLDLFGKLRIT